jgi:two-component system, sensor histidine kinase
VSIPSAPRPAEADRTARPRADFESPDLSGLKVLVVDDEEAIVNAMTALLESWGCEVHSATSVAGATAVLAAMGERPDLMIVDFRLRNGETGIEIARNASARHGRIPAILITGDTAPDRLREAAESGLRLVHKPVTGDALRRQIETVLELREG